MVAEEVDVVLRGVAEVHPWWENGDAKQVNNAEIF